MKKSLVCTVLLCAGPALAQDASEKKTEAADTASASEDKSAEEKPNDQVAAEAEADPAVGDAEVPPPSSDAAPTEPPPAEQPSPEDTETPNELSAEAKAEYDAPERKALVLHAEAISAENRGEHSEALVQLREAYALTPDADRVRFDLARVALLYGGERSDLRPYYEASPPDDPGAQMLYAAVAKELETKLNVSGRDSMFRGSVRLGITFDDNVAIAPNDSDPFQSPTGAPPPTLAIADPQTGVRGVMDALVLARPLDAPILTVEGIAGVRVGTFLNSDDGTSFESGGTTVTTPDLGTFDAQRLYLGGRVSSAVAGLLFRGALTGAAVFADGFGVNFSQSLGLGVETLYGDADDNVGLYGDFSAYNFGAEANPEDTPFDRDGTTLGGGLSFAVNRSGLFGFTARLGVFNESTDGDDLDVQGAKFDFAFLSQAGPVSVAVGSGTQARLYGDASIGDISEDSVNARLDGLIQPFARVLVGITDNVGVYGNYGYTINLSTDDDNITPAGGGRLLLDRRYSRNFFEIGVEGRL
ncbi:MAG: hypothetical protein AAF654_03770 [Myxococcota bacterium]